LLLNFRELLAELGYFFFQFCDAIRGGICGGMSGRVARSHTRFGWFAGEKMGVTGFFRSGLAREYPSEWWFALRQPIERGYYIIEGFEVIHAFGPCTEFTGSLGSAKQQHADDGDFSTIKVEYFLQSMFEFRDAAVGATCRTGHAFFLKRA